jgi:dephospho-CoA kinase
MNTDPEVRAAVAELLGPEVLTTDGLDRQRIAELVFGATANHKERLDALDRIVHPRVLERHIKLLDEYAERGLPLVAIESALLYEVGLEDGFDYVVVVDAPDDVRIQRVMMRSGLTEEQVRQRMADQVPMGEIRLMADFVLDNSGTLEELGRAANKLAAIIEILPEGGL